MSIQFQQKKTFLKSLPVLMAYTLSEQKQVDHINKNGILRKNNIFKTFHPTVKSEKQIQNTNNDVLLKILHEAIFQKQIYPEEAILMHEQGTVELSLMVHPDGLVDQVNILKSSGYPVIDEAAKNAVAAISPIPSINNYLKEATRYSVNVNFS